MEENESADLTQQVHHLQEEKRKMQNEFDTQRAKMKDLFIQKEAEHSKCQLDRQALQRELDEMKSQFLVADLKSENEMHLKEMRAQEEISSLQQLVQDTIEESTICKTELERIKEECGRLWNENRELRDNLQQVQQHQQHQQQQPQQESTGLAPEMLNKVKKTLVRKLGGDTILGNSFHQDSIDETSRTKDSGKPYAYEDAEVLRSIVVQLQEEMKALKEKLREADEKLQANSSNLIATTDLPEKEKLDNNHTIDKSTSIDIAVTTCDSCQNYEIKIEEMLEKQKLVKENIDKLQKSINESREDLQKEAALRKDLESQWQEKREAHKTEVQMLCKQVEQSEQQLLELQQKFLVTKDEVVRQLLSVTEERESINKHLETLQADNDFLSGRYIATAEEIENQCINLPNNVEELQELMLRLQIELIQARVGSEFERKKRVSSLDEIQILRHQLNASNNEQREYKKKSENLIKSLQDRLTDHLVKVQKYETTKIAWERKESELNRQISELRVEIFELQEKNEKLSKLQTDSKNKIKNLQDDLVTSEQVQKDFVKLSQTLQMSLEKLRHADTEVRWQDDEDIDNCPSCNIYFTVTVRKFHCRHCGHIYCDKCLTKTVPSGPRKRVARVCDICHTLLTPNTAPYFSHEPLSST